MRILEKWAISPFLFLQQTEGNGMDTEDFYL